MSSNALITSTSMSVPEHSPLPTIECHHAAQVAQEKVRELALRGKMPGFVLGKGEDLFEAQAFGHHLDYRMLASHEPGKLRFELRMARRVPAVLLVVLAVTIWPGVWLTDSMLKTYFDWYTIPTWIWYIPLTVIPVPFMWRRMVRQSRAAAEESARELIERIRVALSAGSGV